MNALIYALVAQADIIPAELLGPSAALVGALIIVGVLWREDRHNKQARIDDLKAATIEALAARDVVIVDLKASRDLNAAGWREQTSANVKLAEAWEARNRAEDGRRRRSD